MCYLITCFRSDGQVVGFMGAFFATLAREWYGIDRWRMDKFMMFVRKFLRQTLVWLRDVKQFNQEACELVLESWCATVASPESEDQIPQGLKSHFASVYLDELDLVCSDKLSPEQVQMFLNPFMALLGEPISDFYFDAIVKEILESILLAYSADREGKQGLLDPEEKQKQESAVTNQQAPLQFDYGLIADALFEVGKAPKIHHNRRSQLYEFVKKFRAAALGEDPCGEYISSGSEIELSDSEIDAAAERLLARERKMKEKLKRKRKRNAEDFEDQEIGKPLQDSDEDPNEMTMEEIQGLKPKKGQRSNLKRKRKSDSKNALKKSPKPKPKVPESNSESKLTRHKGRYFSPKNIQRRETAELSEKKKKKANLHIKSKTAKPSREKVEKFIRNPPAFARKAVEKLNRTGGRAV